MRQNNSHYVDPEDMFADTRMSFGEHLEDLRVHLIRAGLGFLAGMIFCLIFMAKPALEWIAKPVQEQLFEYYKRTEPARLARLQGATKDANIPAMQFPMVIDVRPLRKALNLPDDRGVAAPVVEAFADLLRDHGLDKNLAGENHWVEVQVRIGNPRAYIAAMHGLKPYTEYPSLKSFTITETIFVYFQVGMLAGLVFSSPLVFHQIWSFIAAGLYPQEKVLVHRYLPFSIGLFLGGVFLCQFFVIPKAIAALLWFNEWLGVDPELRLSDWLGFAIMLPVVFGVSFQTPLVMMFFNKIGLIDVEVYREKRRIAWFLMAIFAAVITPTPDPYNMMLLWIPVGLLYELGVVLCAWQQKHAESDGFGDEISHDEMVEV
jgi:sec-independent protein translocase protein TatC